MSYKTSIWSAMEKPLKKSKHRQVKENNANDLGLNGAGNDPP